MILKLLFGIVVAAALVKVDIIISSLEEEKKTHTPVNAKCL